MIKKVLPHIIAAVVFVIMGVIYFMPQLEGKVIVASDTMQVRAMQQEVVAYEKETGIKSLWTDAMFGGMPTYHITSAQKNNFLEPVKKVMTLGFKYPIGGFLLGMFSFYIMLLLLGVNHWLAIIGGLLFSFSSNNLILYEAGHTSKVATIMTSPLVISGMLLLFRKKWIVGLAVFSLGMGLNIMSKHPQMTYYLGMVMGLLVIIYLINAIRSGALVDFAKSMGLILVGVLLGIGASTSELWTTYEYSKDTMRGKPILTAEASDASSSSAVEGLAWDYAMQWSNGGLDLLSSYIPNAVGGGSGVTISKDSNFGKAVRSPKELPAPMYWGALPFTSGPIYFGALVVFLFLFGAIAYQSPAKWWLVSAVVLTMFLSLGKNFEFFNRLFFDYLPWYNKFRTPNSVLSITAILMPILGLLALQDMFKTDDKERFWKAAKISGGVLGGIALVLGLVGPSIFDFSSAGDARIPGELVDPILKDRAAALRTSSLRTVFIILIGIGLIWAYLNEKLSALVVTILIGLVGLFDLFQVDRTYVNYDDFVSKRKYATSFTPRAVDRKILEDTDIHYRVHDVSTDPFNSASASYHHKTIGGYHAAKLQRYQDVIDRHISQSNMAVLNMLNAKYFIIPSQQQQGGGEPTYQLNPAALGNAWFVRNVQMVNSANEEIDALTNLDPGVTAIVHNEFSNYITQSEFNQEGRIQLTSYAPNKIVYSANAQSDQFAVFSEIWYGPDKGWRAYVDGKEVDFIRTNYILRGMNIPAGQHEIVFEFKPTSYYTGSKINMVASSLILLLIAFAAYQSFVSYKDEESA